MYVSRFQVLCQKYRALGIRVQSADLGRAVCHQKHCGLAMSWSGGAASWYSRRGGSISSDDDEQSWDEQSWHDEVPLEQGCSTCPRAASASFTDDAPCGHGILSKATYEAVKDIFTPAHEVKKKTGELLLKGRGRGEYRLFTGIDLDGETLDSAGHMPASATQLQRIHFAEDLAEACCSSRCGVECTGECHVRSFVVTVHGVDFYFGSREDITDAVLTCGAACDVWIWDELEHATIPRLYRMLDSLLQTIPGLAMRTTELKTVPGQVRLPHPPTGHHRRGRVVCVCVRTAAGPPPLRCPSLDGVLP